MSDGLIGDGARNSDGPADSALSIRSLGRLGRKFLCLSRLAGASCAALMLPASPALAQSVITVYGLADIGIEVSNSGKGTQTREVSGGLSGSRLGFRGREDLGGGLAAIFNLQMGFNIDDGTSGQGGRLFGREAVGGLTSTSLGTALLGRREMPYVTALILYLDAFQNGMTGTLNATSRSTPTATFQLLPLLITFRVDNSVNYISPEWNGLEARVQYAPGENSPTIGKHTGGSLRYAAGPLAIIGAVADQRGPFANGRILATAFGGNYDLKVARLYLGFAEETNSCTPCTGALARVPGTAAGGKSEFRYLNAGARVPVGAWTFIVQGIRMQDETQYAVNPGDRDVWRFAAGFEYALSRRTVLYGSAGTVDNKNGSSYALGTTAVQQPPNSVDRDHRSNTGGVGVRHVF